MTGPGVESALPTPGERRHVERAAAVALGPPDAGSRLDRDGQDPVLEGAGGLAVVVREDAVGAPAARPDRSASEPRATSAAYAIHFVMAGLA